MTTAPVPSVRPPTAGAPVLPFLKVEGLGNDFLLIDLLRPTDGPRAPVQRLPAASPEPHALARWIAELQRRAPALCDQRTGVGGDGLLLVTPPRSPGSVGAMVVINHDGSRPEMCGNGLRCVALYLAQNTAIDVSVELHRLGAQVLVQDEASSVVWGMPSAVFEAGVADEVLPVDRIAAAIVRLTALGAGFRRGAPVVTTPAGRVPVAARAST